MSHPDQPMDTAGLEAQSNTAADLGSTTQRVPTIGIFLSILISKSIMIYL